MDFSTMVLSMYLDDDDSREADERVLESAVDQALTAARLGFNPWFTEHHFRGPWHSSPIQFASYIAGQIPAERYLGFGVLSVPYHHPVRLVEQMNLLDQLTKGHTLFGMGSGFAGIEPASAGLTDEYHGSGQATRDSLEVIEHLWSYESGEPPYEFATELYRGRIERRIMPSPYRHRRPTIVRTARRDDAVIEAAKRGWPAFLGSLGADLAQQAPLYFSSLASFDHTPETLEECQRWSTVDWLSVLVAPTDREAESLAGEARTERMERRDTYLARTGGVVAGPTATPGEAPTPASYAAGGDMVGVIAGSPATVAERVQEVASLGVNHLLVRFLGEWHGRTRAIAEQSMQLFASEVMPNFAARPVAIA
jgi:alkanesulfonate monooxygenase SsuD/methylene tetrahydromethanopterin reductase-like flavin-dependent oxidoreductase (luciferase family)